MCAQDFHMRLHVSQEVPAWAMCTTDTCIRLHLW